MRGNPRSGSKVWEAPDREVGKSGENRGQIIQQVRLSEGHWFRTPALPQIRFDALVDRAPGTRGEKPLPHINQTASTSTMTWVRGIFCSTAWISIDLSVALSFSRLVDFRTKW